MSILKTLQEIQYQLRSGWMVLCVLFFSFDLRSLSKLSPPTACTFSLKAALWHFPSSVLEFFHSPLCFLLSCLSPVFFPVCLPLTTLLYLSCFMLPPPLSRLSLLPLLCTLLPLPFLSPAFFSHTFSCLHSFTGTEKKFELTPVAAISVHLLAGDGVELQVTGPITFSVPLPPDSGLKENDHLPAWRFDPRLGMYQQKLACSFFFLQTL